MLCLDEFGAGGVTPSRLDEIAAGDPLKDVLKMYMNTGNLLTLNSVGEAIADLWYLRRANPQSHVEVKTR
jgi:hypothetical protein